MKFANEDNNYISLEFIKVDDCVREIVFVDRIIFSLKESDCNYDNQANIHPKFFIKNGNYEYGKEIRFVFEDNYHLDGYFEINVYFNEFFMKLHMDKENFGDV